MEVALVAAAGLVMGAAAYVLTGGGPARAQGAPPPGPMAILPAVQRVLESMGRSRVCALALDVPLVRGLAGDAARAARRWGVSLDEGASVALLACALALLGAVAGALLASAVAGVAAVAAAAAWAVVRDRARRQRGRREAVAAMPGIYRTLSVALGSGQTLAQAVEHVGAQGRGRAVESFARMSLRLRCGFPTEEAAGLLAQELGAPGAELLATALVISHRTGSPLGDLLTRSAALAERQGELARMLVVKTAQARLSVQIVCLMPALMVCLLALISPDFQEGLLTPAGLGCVALAALLDGCALLIIRRLVRGVM